MQLSDIAGPIIVVNQKYHVNWKTIFVILIGFFFGCGFSYLFFSDVGNKFNWRREYSSGSNNNFASPLSNPDDKNVSTLLTTDDPDKEIPVERGYDADGQELSKKVKVLCWIMTQPKYHLKKAINIKKTWGRRCTKLLFMSTQVDSELQSIALRNVQDTQEWRWGKTKEAIKYIYNHHLADADWFLKADDDTFVIMENLRYLLSEYDSKKAYLFGCEFKPQWLGRTYVSGEAGYAMSKEAVKRFVEKSLKMNDSQCLTSKHTGAEDIEISKCLSSVNTTIGDSRDSLGRYRFMPFHPTSLLVPGVVIKTSWYWNWIKYPQKAVNSY